MIYFVGIHYVTMHITMQCKIQWHCIPFRLGMRNVKFLSRRPCVFFGVGDVWKLAIAALLWQHAAPSLYFDLDQVHAGF